jgi:osmotically-inducible protein OsmY
MKKLNRTLALLAAAALVGLAGCANTGADKFFDDAMVTARVKKAIFDEPSLKVTDISVTTENSVVTLTGSVKSRSDRTKAGDVARHVEGVKQVRNGLKVAQ